MLVVFRTALLASHACGPFLLGVDGLSVAWTHPPGEGIQWLEAEDAA